MRWKEEKKIESKRKEGEDEWRGEKSQGNEKGREEEQRRDDRQCNSLIEHK